MLEKNATEKQLIGFQSDGILHWTKSLVYNGISKGHDVNLIGTWPSMSPPYDFVICGVLIGYCSKWSTLEDMSLISWE